MPLIHASMLDTSPPVYIVDGMLPDMGAGFGYGSSYTGKSLVLGIELCLAIANGVPFFGHETIQGAAAWAMGEGLADAGVRIKARLVREQYDRKVRAAEIERQDGPDAADAWLAGLPAYTDDRMFVRTNAFQVPFPPGTSNEPTEELRQAATELALIPDLRLVVLDTARRFSQLSLSNGTTANRFMLGMSWLAAQLQCTVMAIGHPVTKSHGESGLNETLYGASDFVWRVQATEDSTPDAPRAMIVAEKVKSGPVFKPLGYALERIQWHQPPTDPETGDDIPGVPLITVSSVTVRQQQDEQQEAEASLQPAATRTPLPDAEPVPPSRPHRRTGIRPQASFRAIGMPAPAEPAEPAAEPLGLPARAHILREALSGAVTGRVTGPAPDEHDRDALVTSLISLDCPREDCAARAGTSCAPDPAHAYVKLAENPLVCAHIERLDAAVSADAADIEDVVAQFPEDSAPRLPVTAGMPGVFTHAVL